MEEKSLSYGVEQKKSTPYEVYVHVPFCLRRCGYCDFNTYTAVDLGGGVSRTSYADIVIREMNIVKRWQEEHNILEPPAHTVFFGGGTPTILPAHDLVRILHAIDQLWGIEQGAEITTEANPDTVDADYLKEIYDGGFNRVSFGMQSAVPHVLKTLDRTHDQENVISNIDVAKRIGLRSSIDLIYGTPGESLVDWKTSVRAALNLDIDHISAYALSLEPNTKMGRMIAAGKLEQPDDDDEAVKYEIADDMFESSGLSWYEVSNWSTPGNESQHNLGYWHNVDWAGLGPGAHSHYNKAKIRSWDIAHPKMWGNSIQNDEIPWADSEHIDDQMNIEEMAILGLRLRDGLNIEQFERAAGMKIPEVTLDELLREGLATLSHGHLIATRRGRLLNDSMISQILSAVGI
ncbi:coproporphyrinogen III oxidase [Alloscardovia theropitheci]|uniref:Heme chaperone HemW n=1 Tax=Alloscardovia theropitheci TaxID=2496842 RepID=A0A4R0QYV0_9BIFI|nr:radical SAM family heme chaperone HemW [Alloscardovia theropitheci]TCD54871.1 coproporphyrinogen III oxidase [Alloscardovia theropitheci]